MKNAGQLGHGFMRLDLEATPGGGGQQLSGVDEEIARTQKDAPTSLHHHASVVAYDVSELKAHGCAT